MISASAEGITIINFGMGSPNAAIIMDLLSAIQPKACLFLGKCGGIDKKNRIGDLILPIAAIRGEGTSNDYFPPEVPSLPAFMLQRAVSSAIRDYARDYWTGTVYTTNRRIWEHDENFKEYLKKTRAMAVDMETATLFSCGFANHIPTGALLLVSDQPSIDGKLCQFSTKQSIQPDNWNTAAGKAKGRDAGRINALLDDIRSSLNTIYHEMQRRDNYVTA